MTEAKERVAKESQSLESYPSPLSILIVKLTAIGDVIHALPVSAAIKKTYPTARIVWVVEPVAKPILELNPCVDEIITFEKKKFKSLAGFFREFLPFRQKLRAAAKKDTGYDYALDLQGLFKSAAIVMAAGAKKRLGPELMREGAGLVSQAVKGTHQKGHIVERNLDVARAIGCQIDRAIFPLEFTETTKKEAAALLERNGLEQNGNEEKGKYVVLVVGASRPNKRWPVKNFAVLAKRLTAAKLPPVFVGGGSADEAAIAEIKKSTTVPIISLVGQTSLSALAAIIKKAALLVGGDTGPVHLAAALNVPTIMLMGPTDANRNGPYGQKENAIEADRPCKHCWKRVCPKGIDCLEAISVDTVFEKIMDCLNDQPRE